VSISAKAKSERVDADNPKETGLTADENARAIARSNRERDPHGAAKLYLHRREEDIRKLISEGVPRAGLATRSGDRS
jgi:hypothetical protein